jgi:3-dehydrotetronate 4-kinase
MPSPGSARMGEGEELLLGCIADDFTGATDLANTLTRRGMRTIQTIGVPADREALPDVDAVVIALKTRTAPRHEAVSQSLAACRWLKNGGARQFYFKYCSTFDSTHEGNIGPVADALLGELAIDFTTICPAFPETGRTVYQGHLFVGAVLLSDSPMRHHPLTPMTDANLLRVLSRQTRAQVGLIPWATVKKGTDAIKSSFADLRRSGMTFAIVDALEDDDLLALGRAGADLKLMTGGSGAAIGLAENFRKSGLLAHRSAPEHLPEVGGGAAVLSGSCSTATLRQIAAISRHHPAFKLDVMSLAHAYEATLQEVMHWALPHIPGSPILIYASAPPQEVAKTQAALGAERAGNLVERSLADLAKLLSAAGVRRLVVAGGETSGAVVTGLGIAALRIGEQIAPGVPATVSLGEPQMALALKSGNFGSDDFFRHALAALK